MRLFITFINIDKTTIKVYNYEHYKRCFSLDDNYILGVL